jgi:hypothetical protein
VEEGMQLPLKRQALQGLGLQGLGAFLMDLHRIGTHVEGHITHVQKVIGWLLPPVEVAAVRGKVVVGKSVT